MVRLHRSYRNRGFTVFAFPCNQFFGQEPGTNPEIAEFAKRYGVEFPMFAKIDVNGSQAHPVFRYLKAAFPGEVSWNFKGRWLIARNGTPVHRFEGSEAWSSIEERIVAELDKKE